MHSQKMRIALPSDSAATLRAGPSACPTIEGRQVHEAGHVRPAGPPASQQDLIDAQTNALYSTLSKLDALFALTGSPSFGHFKDMEEIQQAELLDVCADYARGAKDTLVRIEALHSGLPA